MAEFNKNADEPIIDAGSDKFGRANFAKGLAEALVKVPNSQSFTVGLHGAWGSGKTSIIKMAEEYLDKQYKDDVIVISFNPWIFSNTESLHVALFGALAQGIGKRLDEDIAVDLRKYAELTGAAGAVIAPFFPPAPLLARILTGGMSALSGDKKAVSAESIKLRVDKMLKESNKRVIVVIDDIDRLDSDEIHLVFKDFSNNLPALMWVWNKWGSPQAIKAYLGKAFAANGQSAITFLDSYVGHAYDMLSGRKSRSEFRREAYNEIAKFADPEIFVKPLAALYGNEFDANMAEFPLSRLNKEEPFEKLVAKQFLYIHRAAQKETSADEE